MTILEKLGITPGPWKGLHGGGIDRRGNHHIVSNDGDVAIICRNEKEVSNSVVIAASPEMLEALFLLVERNQELPSDVWFKIGKAIMKATDKTWSQYQDLIDNP